MEQPPNLKFTAASYRSPITGYQYLAKLARNSFLLLLLTFSLAVPSHAHQPVNLTKAHSKVGTSPILVDGDISWAVYARVTKANQVRHFRFSLTVDDLLQAQYLIRDRNPENTLKNSQLPTVTIKSPSGATLRLDIKERTPFFEQWSKESYIYLSRLTEPGESGIYTVTIRGKRSAEVVIAVGTRETRGEVLPIGSSARNCPLPTKEGVEIPLATARQLIGVSERAAQLCAAVNKWIYRLAARDGEQFALTRDYRIERINVEIEKGIITEVTVG